MNISVLDSGDRFPTSWDGSGTVGSSRYFKEPSGPAPVIGELDYGCVDWFLYDPITIRECLREEYEPETNSLHEQDWPQ